MVDCWRNNRVLHFVCRSRRRIIAKAKLSYTRRGDLLEVKLRDEHFDIIYTGKARIKDKKEMRNLSEELKKKGVNFPVGWFD